VGSDFAITAASDNLIEELDGGEAATTLQGFWKTLDPIDRGRFRQAPMVGLAMGDGGTDRDYLVRDLLGVERSSGRIAVSTGVEPGMTLRFHVRDPQAAEEDLRGQLLRWKTTPSADQAVAAVLFSCLGRGEGFFGTPAHDSRLLHSIAGEIPVAGFFCNGELGPVHGTTWMHAYTTVIGLFRTRGWS
jgi:small ligand-binding sensory domain FIST